MSDDTLYSVRGPKSWHHMTSREIEQGLAETDIVLVPVGAIEQHASHLPLMTDTYATEEMVRRAVIQLEEEGNKAIFGPSIPFGPVPDMRFPGSINIRPTTMVLLVKEFCYSLHHHGAKKIVLVLGHDFTCGPLMVAARELAEETNDELMVIVANWLPLIVQVLRDDMDEQLPKGKLDAHGGAGETSRMLWLYPSLVDKDYLTDYEREATTSQVPWGQPIVAGGGIYVPQKISNRDPEYPGIVGFPSLASAEMGDRLFDVIGNWLAEIVKEYCYGPVGRVYNY
jgi:creatinine amidohydrolase